MTFELLESEVIDDEYPPGVSLFCWQEATYVLKLNINKK